MIFKYDLEPVLIGFEAILEIIFDLIYVYRGKNFSTINFQGAIKRNMLMKILLKNVKILCIVLKTLCMKWELQKLSQKMLNKRVAGREGTIGCLFHQSPKFYNNVFLFVDLTTLGIFIELT